MRLLFTGFCSLLLALGTAQQSPSTLRTEEDARALTEAAMQQVVAGEYQAAFEILRPHWPLPMGEFDTLLQTTMTQRSTIAPRFGSSLGYELVRSETVGDSLLRFTYIEKTERHVLRWLFRFYKPEDVWIINSLEWDDEVEALFGD